MIGNWLKAMKQKIKIPTKQIVSRSIAALSVAVVVIASQSSGVYAATLEELRAQNTALQNQINDNNAKAKELAAQADTLQNQLAELNLQIKTLQSTNTG